MSSLPNELNERQLKGSAWGWQIWFEFNCSLTLWLVCPDSSGQVALHLSLPGLVRAQNGLSGSDESQSKGSKELGLDWMAVVSALAPPKGPAGWTNTRRLGEAIRIDKIRLETLVDWLVVLGGFLQPYLLPPEAGVERARASES